MQDHHRLAGGVGAVPGGAGEVARLGCPLLTNLDATQFNRAGDYQMKLADIDVDEFVKALHMERSAWIKAPKEQGRRETEAEKITICMLAALEHAFANAGAPSDAHLGHNPPSR